MTNGKWRPAMASHSEKIGTLPDASERDEPRPAGSGTFRSAVWRRALAVALIVAFAAGLAGAQDDTSGRRALRELFAQDDPPAAVKQFNAVLSACGSDPAVLGRLIASDTAYEPMRPGWRSERIGVSDGAKQYNVAFDVYVPSAYRPDRPCPLLLAAHGQSVNGRQTGQSFLRLLGREAEKTIVVAPTLPGTRLYSGKAYQEQAFLGPLQWARRRLNVDDDRIAVSGYSLGGHSTWHLAVLFPRHFSAAVAMAGAPLFEGAPHTANLYLENLSNLPLWSIWGALDKPPPPAIGQVQFNRAAARRLKELGNARFRPTEMQGVGHGGCWPKGQAFAAFLSAAPRRAVPEKFAHFFHLEHHKRGYYLEALRLSGRPMQMDGPIRIKFRRTPGDPNGDRAAEQHFARYLFKMWGELDRPSNSLTVRTSRITAVRVYATEGMFDLSRPVTIRLNGRSWQGPVKPSARCMLVHYAADRDASAVVYNEIDFSSTAGVAVRHK